MDDNFRDCPIQIVTIREDGDFEITVDGINFLSALKNKKVNKISFLTQKYFQNKHFLILFKKMIVIYSCFNGAL